MRELTDALNKQVDENRFGNEFSVNWSILYKQTPFSSLVGGLPLGY